MSQEYESYKAFVESTINHINKGLQIDGVFDPKVEDNVEFQSYEPAKRVMVGRYVLGQDDGAYLLTGLLPLWTTAGDKQNRSGELAPAALYAPDAFYGVRRGMMDALKARYNDLKNGASVNAQTVFMHAIVPLLHVKPFRDLAETALKATDGITIEQLEAIQQSEWDDPNKRDGALRVMSALLNALKDATSISSELFKDMTRQIHECEKSAGVTDKAATETSKPHDPHDESHDASSSVIYDLDGLKKWAQFHSQNEDLTKRAVILFDEWDLSKTEEKARKKESNVAKIKKVEGEEEGDVEEEGEEEGEDDWVSVSEGDLTASYPDPIARHVIVRGLVGQHGPLERATTGESDKRLPYQLPDIAAMSLGARAVASVLKEGPEPTDADMIKALAHLGEYESSVGTGLEWLNGDFAVVGRESATMGDAHGGVEVPHEVRWMPSGHSSCITARVAALEHAVARCSFVAKSANFQPSASAALTKAAAALKAFQLPMLYDLRVSADLGEAPRQRTIGRRRLVTRPCAVVRHKLSFSHDAIGVAPLPDETPQYKFDNPESQRTLREAFGKRRQETMQLRNVRRRLDTGMTPSIHVLPDVHEMPFVPIRGAETGVSSESVEGETSDNLNPHDFSPDYLVRMLRKCIVLVHAIGLKNENAHDPIEAMLEEQSHFDESTGGAFARREALFGEFTRELAIGHDRLWIFLRLLSGMVGGDVNEVVSLADEASIQASKQMQAERMLVVKRVSETQAKIVEIIMSSILKDTKLSVGRGNTNGEDGQLMVIDGEAQNELRALSEGQSGRPFFDANVGLQNLRNSSGINKTTLSDLFKGVAKVGGDLEMELLKAASGSSTGGPTLSELSHPSNSYFVKLRPDVVSAIRQASETMNVELGIRGAGRRLQLWECVEGGCAPLVTRFAELVGHLLVQSRASTGVSSLYIGNGALITHARQSRVALDKLVRVAKMYTDMSSTRPEYRKEELGECRETVMKEGAKISDRDVGIAMGASTNVLVRPSVRLWDRPSAWAVYPSLFK